jgi:demethylmenaquinone methyltransferase/2-methoxy-6-polyprenyl-1,4-benzoquinol methylase
MLAAGRERVRQAGLAERIELVEGRAEELPFPDGAFDALTFTYLLRYVDDPAATLAELARVIRPGGTMAALEFGLPRGLARPLWELYTGALLPIAGAVISPGWREVGGFLRGSIRAFYGRLPLEEQLVLWRDAGLHGVRARQLTLGGGVVTWGERV